MARRTSGDLTIRLGPAERRRLEAAAAKQHLAVSTWLRQLALKAAEGITPADEAERQRSIERALAVLGSFTKEEADALRESVRQGREGWGRGRR